MNVFDHDDWPRIVLVCGIAFCLSSYLTDYLIAVPRLSSSRPLAMFFSLWVDSPVVLIRFRRLSVLRTCLKPDELSRVLGCCKGF